MTFDRLKQFLILCFPLTLMVFSPLYAADIILKSQPKYDGYKVIIFFDDCGDYNRYALRIIKDDGITEVMAKNYEYCYSGTKVDIPVPSEVQGTNIQFELYGAIELQGDGDLILSPEEIINSEKLFTSGIMIAPPPAPPLPAGFELEILDREDFTDILNPKDYLGDEEVRFAIANEDGAYEFVYTHIPLGDTCMMDQMIKSNGEPENKPGVEHILIADGKCTSDSPCLGKKMGVDGSQAIEGIAEQFRLCYSARSIIEVSGIKTPSEWSPIKELEFIPRKKVVPECLYFASRAGDIAQLNSARNDAIIPTAPGHVSYHSSFYNDSSTANYIESTFPSFTICEGGNCFPKYKTFQDQWNDRVFIETWCRNKLKKDVTLNIGVRSSLPGCYQDSTGLCLEAYLLESNKDSSIDFRSSWGLQMASSYWGFLSDGYHQILESVDSKFKYMGTFAIRNPTDIPAIVSGDMLGLVFQAANYNYDTFKLDDPEVVSHKLSDVGATFNVGVAPKANEGDLTCNIIFDGQGAFKNVTNQVYYSPPLDVTFQLQLLPKKVDGKAVNLPPNLTVPIDGLSKMIVKGIEQDGVTTASMGVVPAGTVTTVSAEYKHDACMGGVCKCSVKVFPKGVARNTINIVPAGNCELYSKMKAHYFSDAIKKEVLNHEDTVTVGDEKYLSFEDPALGKVRLGKDVPVRGIYNFAEYDMHSRVPTGLENKIVFGYSGALELPHPLYRKFDELVVVGRVVVGTKPGVKGEDGAVALSGPVLYAIVNPLKFEITGIFPTTDPSGTGYAIEKYLTADKTEKDLDIVFEAVLKKRRVTLATVSNNTSDDVDDSWKPNQSYYEYDTFNRNTFLSEYLGWDFTSESGQMNKRFELASGVDFVVPFMESSCTNMLPFTLPTMDYIAKDKNSLTPEEQIIYQRATDLNNKTMCRYSRPFTYEEIINGNVKLSMLAIAPHNPVDKFPSNLARSSEMPKSCDVKTAAGAPVTCWSLPESYMPKALKNPNNRPYDTHKQCHERVCKNVSTTIKYKCNCGPTGCKTCSSTQSQNICSDNYKPQCMVKEVNASQECGNDIAFRFTGYVNQMVASLGCVAKYDRIINGKNNLVAGVTEDSGLTSLSLATGKNLSGVAVTATLEQQGIIPYGKGVAKLSYNSSMGPKGKRSEVGPDVGDVSLGGAIPGLFSDYAIEGVSSSNDGTNKKRMLLRRVLSSLAPRYVGKWSDPTKEYWVEMRKNTMNFPTDEQVQTMRDDPRMPLFGYWWDYWSTRLVDDPEPWKTDEPEMRNKFGYACIPCRFGMNGNNLESSTIPLPVDQDSALRPRQPIYKFSKRTEPESCTSVTNFEVRYFGAATCQPGDKEPEDYVENFCASEGFPSYGCPNSGVKDSFTRPDPAGGPALFYGGGASKGNGSSNIAGRFSVRLCSNSSFGNKNIAVSWSPIVIDIAGAGIFISRTNDESVFFDITGDGTKEWIDWVSNTEGVAFLVRPDKNGQVNSIKELFGDHEHSNGFDALKEYDSNNDGYISSKDKRFGELKLWFDYNRNGSVDDSSELKTLHSQGVQKIHLKYYSRMGVEGPDGRALSSTYYNNASERFQNIMDAYFRSYGK